MNTPALEGKKIVIRFPQFKWDMLFNVRVAIAMSIFLVISAFSFWYFAIHPFLRIPNGRVEAFSTLIYADVPGKISQIGPSEGEEIKKGQILFSLEADFIAAKLKQAKANAEALNEKIRFEKGRMEKAMEAYLSASGEAGILDLDEPVHKHLSILEEAQSESEAAFLQLAKAQSESDLLDLQLKKMSVSAPYNGIVLQKSKGTGAMVGLGEPVYKICDLNKIWIDAEIPETKIGQVCVGTLVKIRLSAYPQKEWEGVVSWISPSASAGEVPTVPVKISFNHLDISLKPGLSAQVSLKIR